MAYFSLHAYDADVWVQNFLGLNQSSDGTNGDPRYAADILNMETPGGVLQPHAGFEILSGNRPWGDGTRVETIMRLHRRWYTGQGSKDWLICAAGGKLYQRQFGENYPDWVEIPIPNDLLPGGATTFQSNVWSWVNYEKSVQGVDYPIDVLIISNAVDGMFIVYPPELPTRFMDLTSKTFTELASMTFDELYTGDWSIDEIDTRADPTSQTEVPKKFGVIERYAERVWAGAVAGEPDMLVYSAPYDPTDWAQNEEIPEDGAGEILQPSWDGDSFTALKAFGNQLLAFKGTKVWRVMGVSPGEYTFNEQYGGGTMFPNTLAVDVERVFAAMNDGIATYDGMSVSPFIREQVQQIWRTANRDALDQMCGCLFKDRYYLAFPVGDSAVNNAVLVYNKVEGTITFFRDMNIESMLPTPDTLYATSSSLPGKILVIRYNSWERGQTSGAATKWVSPWMDFGYKRIQKGGFDFYFTPEVQSEAVTLKISVQTERKTKTKNYTINPLTAADLAKDKKHRNKRLHFSGAGRRFRIIIETEEGNTHPWRLIGGIQMVVETDAD